MRIILTENVGNLGTIGTVVTVKDGYARNFLIPRSMAVLANESNKKGLDHYKRLLEKKKNKILQEAKVFAAKIEKVKVELFKQVGDEGRIFGSVTSAEVVDFLESNGVKVLKKDLKLPDEIKKIGLYEAIIKLHPEVNAKVSINLQAIP